MFSEVRKEHACNGLPCKRCPRERNFGKDCAATNIVLTRFGGGREGERGGA